MPIPKFSADLKRLYEAAGEPPVAALVRRIEEHLQITGNKETPPKGLAGRIGDWKTATTPREYKAIHQHLIQILLNEARARNAAMEGLPTREPDWRKIWEQTAHEHAMVEGSVDRCPYQGLQSYSPEDSGLFYGRENAVEELVTKTRHAASQGGFAMVVGASGAGKSSLLGAGLVPALGHPWLLLTPGADPVKALQIQFGTPLTTRTVRQVVRTWAEDRGTDVVTLVIDQAEELFTMCADKDARDEFMDILAALTAPGQVGDPQILVAMGVRADFVGAFLDYPIGEAALRDHALMLGPMRRDDLREAISAPARQVGLRLESGLEELMINELCGPGNDSYDAGALPMLSYALAETWNEREKTKLTLVGYHKVGGVTGALTATAERTWDDLNAQQQQAARRLLLRLVNVGDAQIRDTRRIRNRSEVVGQGVKHRDEQAALDALSDARLISIDSATVVLTHEILLTGWPRLRRWIDEDRTGLQARQRLERDAAEWTGDTDGLYGGERLAAVERSTATHAADLSVPSQQFLEASRKHEHRKGWRLRLLRVSAVLAVIAIVVTAASYAVQARNANTARANAELGQVLAAADRYQLSDPTLSAHLLLAAQHRAPDNESIYTRILATQNSPLSSELHGAKGPLYVIAISPDGRTVSAASNNTVHMWDISDPIHPRPLPTILGHQSFVTSVAYSPNGETLATTSDDKTTRLWDLKSGTPTLLTILRGHEGTVFYSEFSPDGKTLATVSYDRTVRIWDTSTPSRAHGRGVLTGSEGPVRTLAWSPDGRTLATGGDDAKIRLWDVPNLRAVGDPLSRQTNLIHSLAWSNDGHKLLSGSDDSTAQMWDVSDTTAPRPLGLPFGGHTGALWSVTFSPDGTKASTASVDGTAKVWSIDDAAHPVQLGETLDGASGQLFTAAWSPDGQYLATGAVDGVVRMWRLPTTTLTGHGGLTIPAISADNRTMISGSYDGVIQLWDITRPEEPRELDSTSESAKVLSTTMNADGTRAATALDNGNIVVRDVADSKLITRATLREPTQFVASVAISPDGQWMAATSTDDSVALWDLTNPERPAQMASFAPGGPFWVTQIVVSPDGGQLAVAQANGEVSLWGGDDLKSPALLARDTVSQKAVNSLAFSSTGMLATATENNVRLWRANGDSLEEVGDVSGHSRTIRSVYFDGDGKRMVSGGDGQEVLLWDTSEPTQARQIGTNLTVPGPGHRIAGLSNDSNTIIIGGDNGFLQTVTTDEDVAGRRICEYSRNYLTPERWADIGLGALPYSRTCTPEGNPAN